MPKTQVERMWVIAATIVGFFLLLIGYVMFVSPQNSKTSSAHSQVSAAEAVNHRLQARIADLRNQTKNLAQYQAQLQAAELALPTTSGLPDFLRTLQSIGNATLTTVSSLTVGAPADVTTIAGASRTGSANPASTTAGAGGLRIYSLPINAQVTGTIGALDKFLTQLQTVQPRAVLISQLAESSAGSASGSSSSGITGVSLQLTMQAFVAPSSAAERAQLSAAAGK
jgi:Tfp pilus assembly protein PilO